MIAHRCILLISTQQWVAEWGGPYRSSPSSFRPTFNCIATTRLIATCTSTSMAVRLDVVVGYRTVAWLGTIKPLSVVSGGRRISVP